jgi:hypothetical protein
MVELTLQPGQSVARVAQADGLNSPQVFQWRRLYRQGGLRESGARSTALPPVVVRADRKRAAARDEVQEAGQTPCAGDSSASSPGGIHAGLPGRALISAAEPARCCCERSWRLCASDRAPKGTKIWIAAGVRDMRRGFDALIEQVQTAVEQQLFSGHVSVFCGRWNDIARLLWWDSDGAP